MIPKMLKKTVATILPPVESERELEEVRMIIALPAPSRKIRMRGQACENAAGPHARRVFTPRRFNRN
jgi:hypothetical protein